MKPMNGKAMARVLAATGAALLSLLASAPAAWAQAASSPYTTGYRWSAAHLLTGKILPDPSTTGVYLAQRFTYDANGRLTRIEEGRLAAWQSEAIKPADWTNFTVFETVDNTFDDGDNRTLVRRWSGATQALVQMSYDADDRLECVAQRLNPGVYATLPSACTPGSAGTFGPDQVTRNVYDAAGQLWRQQSALDATTWIDQATFGYSLNGKQISMADAKSNLTSLSYDAYDRREYAYYPSKTAAGTVNTGDYERFTYDANGNVKTYRNRDGQLVTYGLDSLDRVTSKDFSDNVAAKTADVYFKYDLLGRQLEARFGSTAGEGVIDIIDKVGRLQRRTTFGRELNYQYDANGNRTRLAYPDGVYTQYDFDRLNRVTAIRENGAISGAGVLALYAYDDHERRQTLTRGNGATTTYSYDALSRLSSITQNLDGAVTTQDVTITLGYTPAGQINARDLSNSLYVAPSHTRQTGYTVNGLNQYLTSGPLNLSYDNNGNLTSDSAATFGYDAENRMVSGPSGAILSYDPLGRLRQTTGSVTTQFLYDGDNLVAEYDGSGGLLRRYVHGLGVDDPIVWYEGAGMTDRRYMHADQQGSIIAVTDGAGLTLGVAAYDEYGVATGAIGRFQFTGQINVPEVGLYYYKARFYSPTLGRFMQTDPIGYADGLNWYAYTHNDPVNGNDPSGLQDDGTVDTVEVWAQKSNDNGDKCYIFCDVRLPGFRLPTPRQILIRLFFFGHKVDYCSDGEEQSALATSLTAGSNAHGVTSAYGESILEATGQDTEAYGKAMKPLNKGLGWAGDIATVRAKARAGKGLVRGAAEFAGSKATTVGAVAAGEVGTPLLGAAAGAAAEQSGVSDYVGVQTGNAVCGKRGG